MKYEINAEDKKSIAQSDKYDTIVKFLKYKEKFTFKIGDVLVKQYCYSRKDDVANWVTETVSDVNKVPKKFLYAYENEQGVGYIKPILKNGKVGNTVTCMTTFDGDNTRFELDPDYAVHIMLEGEDAEYHAHEAYASKSKYREKAIKANKKLCVPTLVDGPTQEDRYLSLIKFTETLKVGDRFWMGRSHSTLVTDSYEVTDIKIGISHRYWVSQMFDKVKKLDPSLSNVPYKEYHLKILTNAFANDVGLIKPMNFSDFYPLVSFKPLQPLTEDGS